MAPPQNLLQLLQSRTIVDCDTMDIEGRTINFQIRAFRLTFKSTENLREIY